MSDNHENERFDYSVRHKIGDLCPIKLRTIFPHCLVKTPLPYGVKHFSFEGLGGVWGGVGGGG